MQERKIEETGKGKKLLKYLPLLLMLLMAASAGVLLLTSDSITIEGIYARLTGESKPLTVIFLLLFFALKSMTVFVLYNIPVAVTALLFPFWEAVAVNTAGTLICIAVPYFIGRASAGNALTGKLLEKSGKLRRISTGEVRLSFVVSLVLRTLGISNDLLGLFFGSMRTHFLSFIISSFIGIVPGMVIVTMLGGAVTRGFTPEFWVVVAIDAAMIIASLIYYRRKLR